MKSCAPPVIEMSTEGTPTPQSCTSHRVTASASPRRVSAA